MNSIAIRKKPTERVPVRIHLGKSIERMSKAPEATNCDVNSAEYHPMTVHKATHKMVVNIAIADRMRRGRRIVRDSTATWPLVRTSHGPAAKVATSMEYSVMALVQSGG